VKENSIEEDIKNINKGLYELYHASWAKRIFESIKEKLNHILSDYKRVLKENEYMHKELDKQQTTINKYAKENEELENITDKMIDYIMIHQQVKTMRKIFCKHCKLQNSCTYSGIHRNCVIRYFEYISKQGNINKMHENLEKILESEE
jgi:predicted nuclease with TOPRIM domain